MTVSHSDLSSLAVGGRYILDRVVGRGGMGVVYLARDVKHGREVAIKIIPAERLSVEGVQSFHREIRLTARLQHPHILPLLDSGELEGAPFYVTPFVQGGSLRERLNRSGPLPVRTVMGIVDGVGGALEYAHGNGVVHCDIKPENILLSGRHAIVSDFGISRALLPEDHGWRAAVHQSVVTPGYGSPEQILGSPTLDERTDVFSLGCVTFEMLTGRTPFASGASEQDLPRSLRAAVSKAIAPDENRRFASIDRFVRAFEHGAGRSAASEPLVPLVWRQCRAALRWARRRSAGESGWILRNARGSFERPPLGPVSAKTL